MHGYSEYTPIYTLKLSVCFQRFVCSIMLSVTLKGRQGAALVAEADGYLCAGYALGGSWNYVRPFSCFSWNSLALETPREWNASWNGQFNLELFLSEISCFIVWYCFEECWREPLPNCWIYSQGVDCIAAIDSATAMHFKLISFLVLCAKHLAVSIPTLHTFFRVMVPWER